MSSSPVSVRWDEVRRSTVPADALEAAFGPLGLGILIVTDIGDGFEEARQTVLSSSSKLAHLPVAELERITSPETHYNVGWSHGKEVLKDGSADTHKGSFYITLDGFGDRLARKDLNQHDLTAPSIWPEEELIPGFRSGLERFCARIGDVALRLAALCDSYINNHKPTNGPHTELRPLADVLASSITHKARLLHYFPHSMAVPSDDDTEDDWCASHVDDGCLTALTGALYLNEADSTAAESTTSLDPLAGLYIKSRTGALVHVKIPPNSLAFQTGVALEQMSGRMLKAVPHFVRAPRHTAVESRNTLAIFFQPNPEVVLDHETGLTFGNFVSVDYVSRPAGTG